MLLNLAGGSTTVVDPETRKNLSSPDTPAVPFGGIVGQTDLKESLLAVATHPELRGLLIKGEKGTAKSTAVRGLAALMPDQQVVADCPYRCHPSDPTQQCQDCRDRTDPPVETQPMPVVTLPLGATRDRVVGSLSIGDTLAGDATFDPGLLAQANRGILYVDEVNLLDDHLVDVLLDVAASGVNRVERDGVSIDHPAAFILVGTMNPEEGDLRPQLRDRFDLTVTVDGLDDLDHRVAVLGQVLDTGLSEDIGHSDPDRATERAKQRLRTAREHIDAVELSSRQLNTIARLCRDAGVDGHRADIATARAACAIAALDERETVTEADIKTAARWALPHRLRSDPFADPPDPEEIITDHFDDGPDADGEAESSGEGDGADRSDEPPPDGPNEEAPVTGTGQSPELTPDPQSDMSPDDTAADDATEETAMPVQPGQTTPEPAPGSAPDLDPPDAETSGQEGTRTETTDDADARDGPRLRTERTTASGHIDPAATARAAARGDGETIDKRDLRKSIRAVPSSSLIVVAIDASASMQTPMETAKGVVLDLLQDAYEQRDTVAVVTFAGEEATVVLPPTNSVSLAARHLKDLPTGNQTPLADGLQSTARVIDRADPTTSIAVVVTDGKANATDTPTAAVREGAQILGRMADDVLVVDAGATENSLVDDIVATTDGTCIPLAALTPDRVEATLAAATTDQPSQ